jgi:hypothetical protein
MAFEGIHPTFRHVPPSAPRFSMQAVYMYECENDVRVKNRRRTFSPNCAALIAAT